MHRFVSTLKNRKIVQWTVAYGAAAWVTFEIVSQVSETFALSALVGRIVFVVLATGVPVTLVIAWFHGERGRQRNSLLEVAWLSPIVLASAFAVATVIRTETGSIPNPPPDAPARLESATASIAVLPFTNLSGREEDEYFTDGVSEELLNVLARLPNLRVAARSSSFSHKGTSQSIAEIASALDVAYMLGGSIRRSGDDVRIRAQLVSAEGFQVWSETYQRELTPTNVFEVEDEIVREVARQLDLRMDRGDFLGRRPTGDAGAYELVLRATSALGTLDEADAWLALTLFREARTRDPGYAAAHVGEGLALLTISAGGFMSPDEAYPLALEAAERGLDIIPDWDAALGLRARVRMNYLWEIEDGFADAQRAVELNPNNPNNYLAYVQYWAWRGEVSRGCDALAAARRVDPLTAAWPSYLASCLTWAGRPEEAIQAQREAEALDPTVFFFDASVGNAYAVFGRYGEAVELFDRAESVLGQPSPAFAIFLAEVDSMHLAVAKLEEAERLAAAGEYVRPEGMAIAWWALGNRDRSLHWWERGLQDHSGGAVMLRMFEQQLGAPDGIPELRELARRYGMPLPPT